MNGARTIEPQSDPATPDPNILDGLKRFPSQSYHTIQEAESVAGYAIPQPSDEYPLANGATYLKGRPGQHVLMSSSQYTFVPKAPESIGIDVGLASTWGGDATWTKGDKLTINGKSGWIHTKDNGLFFAYKCGFIEGETLWCIIRTGTDIGKQNVIAFVESLR